MKRYKAYKLRELIEKAAGSLEDADALDGVELFPVWDGDGHKYAQGDRVRHGDKLYKVLLTHASQLGWEPDVAASLFAEILPGQDDTDIGEWVQPDSTNPYMAGDRVIHNGVIWESTVDNNVWEPGVYGWVQVE